ncbi:hypothetical protein Ddye_016051 [Dipteronia dyeriana]|uniref:Uncharacterized protein n=1 Tax=Dipteronia dyeriana TaxID=168575 RepID=A0AAD9U661_9ROSI|nr:hypothetical protein Ddye_016051 [Dipteronia dyeriana]
MPTKKAKAQQKLGALCFNFSSICPSSKDKLVCQVLDLGSQQWKASSPDDLIFVPLPFPYSWHCLPFDVNSMNKPDATIDFLKMTILHFRITHSHYKSHLCKKHYPIQSTKTKNPSN